VRRKRGHEARSKNWTWFEGIEEEVGIDQLSPLGQVVLHGVGQTGFRLSQPWGCGDIREDRPEVFLGIQFDTLVDLPVEMNG
jgi:hypothetical protein